MEEARTHGPANSFLDMSAKVVSDDKNADAEGFPCVSHADDDFLQKKKYVPSQMINRWRQAALAVSYASIFCTFVLGIAAIAISVRAKSSATFGFSFESFLDVCSSVVVIWRFCGIAGSTLSLDRERKACIAIAVFFIFSSIGIFARTIYSLSEENHVHLLSGIETTAGVSVVVLSILAWLKFIISDKLSSESLQTDALNSLAGAVMALGMIISCLVYEEDRKIWYIDASFGLCIAFALLVYGGRLLSQLLPPKQKTGLDFADLD